MEAADIRFAVKHMHKVSKYKLHVQKFKLKGRVGENRVYRGKREL